MRRRQRNGSTLTTMATSTKSDAAGAETRSAGLSALAFRQLLGTGAIRAEHVVGQGVTCYDVSQSNSVALVEIGDGTRLAVKHLGKRDRDDQGTAAAELALYTAAAEVPALATLLPRHLAEHSTESMLVLEGLATSRRFDEAISQQHHDEERLASLLGESLGSWHRHAAHLRGVATAHPWMLRIDADDRLPILDTDPRLRALTRRILDDPDLRGLVEALRDRWEERTVIHGDLRFANVMVCRSPLSLRFIDWETSGRGDPDWDTAGPIQEFVTIGIQQSRSIADSWTAQPVETFLTAYESVAGTLDRRRLATFVAGRLLLRSIQLTNWTPTVDSDSSEREAVVERHLEAARTIAAVTDTPFDGDGR